MQFAQCETKEPARQINRQQKPRRERRQGSPQSEDEHGFGNPFALKQRPEKWLIAVMRQMLRLPQTLRKTQEERKECREQLVGDLGTKEWKVNEVVRNRVCIPPQAQRDEW